MRLRVLALALIACSLGCEDAPPELDTGTSLDLSDPAPVHGTHCGDTVCFAEANQYCHTSDSGATGLCVTRSVASPGYYACDGPEDCQSGACCWLSSASACSALGFCVSGTTIGEFMCHGDAECGSNSRCCHKSTTGSYRTCSDGLQPSDPCPSPQS